MTHNDTQRQRHTHFRLTPLRYTYAQGARREKYAKYTRGGHVHAKLPCQLFSSPLRRSVLPTASVRATARIRTSALHFVPAYEAIEFSRGRSSVPKCGAAAISLATS